MTKPIVKIIPPFKSLEDEAHFWDTHDATDLSEIPKKELHPAVVIEKQRRLEDIIAVRFKATDLEKLKKTAEQKGIGVSSLIRMFTLDGLRTSG